MSDQEVPEDEARRYVLRGDQLAAGSRTGHERRTDDRGLRAGRRYLDHKRVRRAFINRVMDMALQGLSKATIARILNDEEFKTASGSEWTATAITQLMAQENERRDRAAWRPSTYPMEDGDGENEAR